MNAIKKWIGFGILIFGLFTFFKLFQIEKISGFPIGSYHCWRQADCVSTTNEFYHGKASLFTPTTHYIKKDGTRIAAGEFPIINSLVSSIYHLTGPSLQTYRYTIFIFYLIGLLFLYLIFFEVSKQSINAALLSLLIGSSSILIFYSINFLPDVPALSLGIVSLYIWLIARRKIKMSLYILAIFLITIACLIKLTMLILLGTFVLVILIEMMLHARRRFHLPVLGSILAGLFIILGWYYHAFQLDHSHPPFIFLTETRSYWKTYFLEKPVIWNDVRFKWLPQVFITLVWYFILGAGLTAALINKKGRIEYKLMTGSALIAAVFFFFMMFRQFMHHDYLWICLIIIPVLFSMIIIEAIGKSNRVYSNFLFGLFVMILLVFQVQETKKILKERYFAFDNNIIYNTNLLEMHNELRKHGIEKTDPVISIPDPSPNITLTIMDQYGYTLYRENKKTEEVIQKKIDQGAKYLIVTNPAEFSESYLRPFVQDSLFHYKDIWVYQLQK